MWLLHCKENSTSTRVSSLVRYNLQFPSPTKDYYTAAMMNNQFLASTSMAALQAPSQFALMTPTFSASAAVPQVAVPQMDNGAAITASMAADELAMQNARPLWRNGEKTFPYKVYDMLEFAESSGNTNICSWLPSGNSFVIHDRKLFTELILPRFFLHKKWRSFTRQLNIWCFKRDFSVTVSDAYCHPFFQRGDVNKLSLVERAESKNLFKKDPITNKRKPPSSSSDSLMPKPSGGAEKQVYATMAGDGTAPSTTSAEPTTKKRRVSSTKEEEDVMDVASFLAGLKSKPKNSSPNTTGAEGPVVPVEKSVEVGTLNSSSNGVGNTVEANLASRILNVVPVRRISQNGAAPSMAALSSTSSIPTTATPNVNIIDGGNIIGMNNQQLRMNDSLNGAPFNRESLRRLSTDQLVALASEMKLREQMLRERTISLQATMPPIAPIAPAPSTNSDFYHEMMIQQQPLQQQQSLPLRPQQSLQQQSLQQQQAQALRSSLPNQGMLPQGMMQSLMGASKPKSYDDLAAAMNGLPQTPSGIPNIAANLGYPRAA